MSLGLGGGPTWSLSWAGACWEPSAERTGVERGERREGYSLGNLLSIPTCTCTSTQLYKCIQLLYSSTVMNMYTYSMLPLLLVVWEGLP